MRFSLPLWRPFALCIGFTLALALSTGCATGGGKAATEWQSFRGKIVWVPRDTEGFWAIDTREFGKINPRYEIAEEFHGMGLRVTGELLLRRDMGSISSWGKVAEIRNLTIIE